MDADQTKIEDLRQGRIPIYEPGLEDLISVNTAEGRLDFTADLSEGLQFGQVIFIAVGTPPGEDGAADLQHVLAVARGIGDALTDYRVIVNKSTVPVGTAQKVRAEIQQGDKGTLQKFDFVLGDYDSAHWYWEIVELIRKLIMAGLIGLVGRGTVLQTVLATLISFLFFALAFREMPYRKRRLNAIKVLSEFQLFVILLVCVVLRTNKNGLGAEDLQQNGYGLCQLVATVAILPATIYVIRMHMLEPRRHTRDQRDDKDDEMTMKNPLGVEG